MPATPSNIINTNLAVGGNLDVTGNTSMTGNLAVTGTVATTGAIASGSALGLITPTLGTFSLDYSETLVTLSTVSDTTTFAISLPGGANVVAASFRIVTAITGTASTDLTLIVNPGGTNDPAGVINSPFTAGSTEAGIAPGGGIGINGGTANQARLVLSNPAGDPPTGGTVRVTVYFWLATAPTS